jgi:protein kinase C substrate 80K-H
MPKVTPSSDLAVEYDEETKVLIEEAQKAKDEYSEIDRKWNDVRQQIEQLAKTQETDFGPDSSFLPLFGQCFELTDREYVYKLCPFDKASQRPKDGGAETSLGRWGKWVHSDDQKYHRQKYEGGATCWNGPARSVDVTIRCGLKNEVISASEPNRCEYAMQFLTPALCLKEESLMTQESHEHDSRSHEEL